MSSVDPFSSRFEVFGREARQVVPEINEAAFKRLVGHLSPEPGADGRVVLLSAPRAGFGKTLLIQRVSETLTENHHFVKVTLMGGRTIDAAHVLEFVLESLCQVLPAGEGLTMLDMVARRIVARGLEPLVRSGEVPCQDRDGALLALQESPVETFDFHHESAVTAHWTEANFEILGPRLAAEVAQVSGASLREAAYWVELFFRFATTSPENVERSRLLFETVFRPDGLKPSESGAGERLHGLLSMLGMATTIVLVIDDTEGLSTHPPDALELATFLTNLAQTCPGTLVLLSVNTDVWETAFAPRLPGGLSDRLTEHRVFLKPLSREGAESIVRSRGGTQASEVLERMEWGEGDLYARRVLRAASEAWDAVVEESLEEAAALDSKDLVQEPEEVAPVPEPAVKSAVKSEGGAVSFSPGAATFLAKEEVDPAGSADMEKALPKVEGEVPEVDPIAEDLKELDKFEPSAYAIPTTPLDVGPDQSGEEEEKQEESSAVSRLATPSEPLIAEEKTPDNPSRPFDLISKPAGNEAALESNPAEVDAGSPSAPAFGAPPAEFVPVEPESLSIEAEEDALAEKKQDVVEKPASPFAAAPPFATAPDAHRAEVPAANAPEANVPAANAPEANAPVANVPAANAPVVNAPMASAPMANAPEASAPEASAPVANAPVANAPEADAPEAKKNVSSVPSEEDSPGKSPFARVWERAEAEAEAEADQEESVAEPGDASDIWADESSAPRSSPFAAVTPTVPPSPFAPEQPSVAGDAKSQDDAETPVVEEKNEGSKFSPFASADLAEKPSEVVLPDDSEPARSPFAPVEPASAEIVLPPESRATPESSPFRPVSGKNEEPAPSPFEAISPSSEKKDDKETGPAKGLEALTGGSSLSEPVSPFEKGASGEDGSVEKNSPATFSPVKGGLPPRRPDSSPFSPARNVGRSPFEKASAPGAAESGATPSSAPPFPETVSPSPESRSAPPFPETVSPPPESRSAPPFPETVSPPPQPRSAPSFPEKASPPPESSGPPPLEEKPVVPSKPSAPDPFPFEDAAPERPASTPFQAVGGDSGAGAHSDDDEDKVDELLRQFKARYGRD